MSVQKAKASAGVQGLRGNSGREAELGVGGRSVPASGRNNRGWRVVRRVTYGAVASAVILVTSLVVVGPRRVDASSAIEVAPGIRYRNDRVRDVPWSIHVLQVDLSRTNLQLQTTLGGGETIGVGVLTDQIRSLGRTRGRPVAAMNGDFFTEHGRYAGDPRGLQIRDGELVSAPNGNPCFWVDREGLPRMGRVQSHMQVIWPDGQVIRCGLNEERESDAVVLYTPAIGRASGARGGLEYVLEAANTEGWLPLRPGRTHLAKVRTSRPGGNSRIEADTVVLSVGPALQRALPEIKDGTTLRFFSATVPSLTEARAALGGNPWLVEGGKPSSARAYKAHERHPRAAIGRSKTTVFLVAVDGRQRHLSIGMTLRELAEYMSELGCEEAVNVDGGGSVEMWIQGRIVNSPCYGHERETGNAVVVLDTITAASGREVD